MARTTKRLHWASVWTGGGTGAIDKIDGDTLIDLDSLICVSADMTTFHSLDDDASGTESAPAIINPDANKGTKSWILTGITIPNTGLHILDTDASHDLIIAPGSNLSADRTLTLTTGDANRTLTLNENLTISDGTNITLTGEDAAAIILMDNANFEVENTNATQRNFKITSAKAGNTTLTLQEDLTIGDGNAGTITFGNSGDTLTINETMILAGASGKTLTLNENLTIGDGTDITITGVTAARTLTLNENLTIGDGYNGTITFSADAKVFTIDETATLSAKANLASPTFTGSVTIPETAGVADYDKFLVVDSGVIKYRTGAQVLNDIGGAAASHASKHAVSGTDTIFPADPGADRILMWDDDPGELVWSSAGAGDVTAAANITDHRVVRGDGGAKGIQESLATIDDSGNIVLPDGGTIGTSDPDAIAISAAGILTFSGQSSCGVKATAQSVSGSTPTKLQLDNELWDVQNEFDSTSENCDGGPCYRFTASVAGKYALSANPCIFYVDDGEYWACWFEKNGATFGCYFQMYSGSANEVLVAPFNATLDLAANDYIEVWVQHNHTSALNTHAGDAHSTFQAHKIG